jgi:hypothetical protein
MAEKKISDLNSLLAVSGGAIIPIVAGDTTYKVTVQELKLYTDQGLALTSSNIPFGGTNTFSSTQNFNGAVFLNGDVNIVGNVIGGIRNEINGLEGYTASLKGQTILSSSAQIAENISGSFTSLSSSITNRLVVVENSISSDNSLLNIFSSSVNTTTSSLIGITNGLMDYTASLKGQAIVSSSQQITNLGFISSSQTINTGSLVTTSSFNLYTASQSTASLVDRLNSIESVTGSLNSYTASLKGAIEISGQDVNVLGMITAQQFNVTYVSSSTLYQSGSTKFGDTTDDKHEFTGSVDVTGGITGSLMATNGVVSSSQQIQNYDVFALNSNLYTITGSLIGITNGLMAFTAALDSTYATDAQVLPILHATASLNEQTGSQDLVNLGISTFTGSIREEINGIEAYTASLKGAAIVSSSTQILNYNIVATTGSNTFVGNQTITGSLIVSGSSTFTNIGRTELTGSVEIDGDVGVYGNITIVQKTIEVLGFPTNQPAFYSEGDILLSGSLSIHVEELGESFDVAEQFQQAFSSISFTQGELEIISSSYATTGSNTFYGNQTISGSLSVSGSVNIDNVIKLTPVTTATFPSGEAGMLVASSSYGHTNIYLYDGFEWKWLVTGSIA